ncbi:MAG: type I pullulanase [Anaeroplasmataceae bacterium]|nr:type I pullulanase [Anaeroplasmataceae bacterium]
MKKIMLFLLLLITGVSMVSCGGKDKPKPDPDPDPTPGPTDEYKDPELPETDENLGFAIHYDQRTKTDDDKFKYNLWLWETGKDGADYQFNEVNSYGIAARYKWSEFSTTAEQNGLGFIVKENKPWSESPTKDTDADRFIDFSGLERDKYGYYNIYLKFGDKTVYTSAEGEVNEMINAFSLAYNTKKGFQLWFQTNKEFKSYEIKLGDTVVFSDTVGTDKIDSKTDKRIVFLLGQEIPSLFEEYQLKVTFESGKELTKIADNSTLYQTEAFEKEYTYTGQLGAIYSKEKTTFRVWSPISTKIELRIYETGTPASLGGSDVFVKYDMVKGEKGTWSFEYSGDCEGKYYTYVVTNATYQNAEVVDPYAKSTGLNGARGMIVDFSKTNPEGWDEVQVHNYKSTGLTVYETHIADLTSSTTWKGTASKAKLFTGFYEAGTSYTENGKTVTTGFDHIKELGVNAVQILPFFDHANEERVGKREFNWGYNPLNYNALDGIYSENPSDGYVKIKEFKNLVKAYNEAGINIIMDVVYNHVSGLEKCNFDVLMPKYYFRYTSAGASNGSGCGNETASEMSMFRKFMIDSTEFWASEYKLGGFRFDLMGIHDVETMNQLAKNLHENVNEAITVYGEPWAGGTIALNKGTAAAQAAMNSYQGYGCFNDQMRDALIKGGLSGVSEKGWITNASKVASSDVLNVKSGLRGLILASNSKLEPEKCVNYVTCHDNYTLYDRIKAAGIKDEDTIKKMAMLSNSIVFTSQGITFMLAGEEFLRTKNGNENSYNASYKVNELNYALKIKNFDMFENYKKLIALKQNTAVFGKDGAACKEIVVNTNADGSMLTFDLVDTVNNRTYRIVHSNGVTASDKTVNLEGYTLYLDTLNKTDLTLTASTTVDNYQTIIAYKNN